jgi:hypothetical protein
MRNNYCKLQPTWSGENYVGLLIPNMLNYCSNNRQVKLNCSYAIIVHKNEPKINFKRHDGALLLQENRLYLKIRGEKVNTISL